MLLLFLLLVCVFCQDPPSGMWVKYYEAGSNCDSSKLLFANFIGVQDVCYPWYNSNVSDLYKCDLDKKVITDSTYLYTQNCTGQVQTDEYVGLECYSGEQYDVIGVCNEGIPSSNRIWVTVYDEPGTFCKVDGVEEYFITGQCMPVDDDENGKKFSITTTCKGGEATLLMYTNSTTCTGSSEVIQTLGAGDCKKVAEVYYKMMDECI